MDSDPGRLRERVSEATRRLTATAAGLTDAQAREPSLLPGWSRGHVLTHLARNADGLGNLLIWARTGVETAQYPSWAARDAAIEAGSGRPAAELAEDLERSAAAFAAEAAAVPPEAWDVQVRSVAGWGHPAWVTLFRRLTELEIHHVDLRAGYSPPDWPAPFVADELEVVTGLFASRGDVPACAVRVTSPAGETVSRFELGTAPAGSAAGQLTVSGPGCWVLAWLTGRDDGASLPVTAGPGSAPAGPPPRMPAWS